MNLIKNIQDRVMLKTSITISSANNEALKNKTTEAKIVAGTKSFYSINTRWKSIWMGKQWKWRARTKQHKHIQKDQHI